MMNMTTSWQHHLDNPNESQKNKTKKKEQHPLKDLNFSSLNSSRHFSLSPQKKNSKLLLLFHFCSSNEQNHQDLKLFFSFSLPETNQKTKPLFNSSPLLFIEPSKAVACKVLLYSSLEQLPLVVWRLGCGLRLT